MLTAEEDEEERAKTSWKEIKRERERERPLLGSHGESIRCLLVRANVTKDKMVRTIVV